MFAKITLVACLIAVVHSGGLQAPGLKPARYGAFGAYGYNTGFGNQVGYGNNPTAYGANPTNYGGAISHVSVVKEIFSRGPYGTNGRGNGGLGFSNAAGWSQLGTSYNRPIGLSHFGAGALPNFGRTLNYGGLGYSANAYRGTGYPNTGAANLAYSGVGHNYASAAYPHMSTYSAAGYAGAYRGVAGYGRIPSSYSNIYNGPLQGNLARSAFPAPSLSYSGYGGYGEQAW